MTRRQAQTPDIGTLDYINFNTSTTGTHIEGRIGWDTDEGTLVVGMPGGNVANSLGQELYLPKRVKNTSGSDMLNGQLVYITGGDGNNAYVALAKADAEVTSATTIAMLTENIANGQKGWATIIGIVRDVNTNAYAPGTVLYLSATTAGGYTSTKPPAPNHLVSVGTVFKQHATEGQIIVQINNGYELNELHDVSLTGSISYLDMLVYNSGTWTNLKNPSIITLDPTGFTDPENIQEFYNSTNRTITLSGTVSAYWRGVNIPALVSGWTSTAHPSGTGPYFLSYDGTNFNWDTSIWTFDKVQIAYVYYGVVKFAIRECHGMMPWTAHEEFHRTVGTYKESGGTVGNVVAGSTTAGQRRPSVTSTVVHDEDIQSTITSAPSGTTYTWVNLASTGVATFTTSQADIVNLTGSVPYYNSYSAPNWGQTQVSNNNYTSVWLIGVPVTADATSQAFRYLYMQGQSEGTLAEQQALAPSSLNLGNLTAVATEFVFLAQFIIQYTAANWKINSVVALEGNHFSQTSLPAGNFLSTVETDSSMIGDGTTANPLVIIGINRVMTSSVTYPNGYCGVMTGYIDTATYDLTLDGDSRLEIL